MPLELFKHQQNILDQNPQKHLLAWETGTGKTITGISLAEANNKTETPILVICPKSLKDQWWNSICKYAKKKYWQVLTKEEFKKKFKELSPASCILVDEAHYFAGMKSALSKSLKAYVKKHKPTNLYLLTATPYLSTPWNVYTLAHILGHEWNYMMFKQKFFVDVRMGPRMVPVVKKNIQSDIAALVNKLGSTVKMQDCVDVPEQTFLTEYFDLTLDQKKGMKQVDEDDFLPIVRFTKHHQICGGTLKDEEESTTFKSEKMQRLLDLCEENKKVVVVCRYNNEIEELRKSLIKKKKTVHVISGQVKDRYSVVEQANKDGECVLLVNAACSEGYHLPSFPIMIFYSYDFSLKNYIQMIGRIQRIDSIKKNVYISLIVKKSIDEEIYKCINNKCDFQIAIYSNA